MKPAKKTNKKNSKPKENVASNSNSNKKIENYFGSAPKPFVIEKIGDPVSTKRFFMQTLSEKLLDNDANAKSKTAQKPVDYDGDECVDGASTLVLEVETNVLDKSEIIKECASCVEKAQLAENWEVKYKTLHKTYLLQSHHFSELQIKYNVLKSVKATHSLPTTNEEAPDSDIFSKTELKILESMSLDKKKDSTFVHQCLEYSYKHDLASFSTKTLKGVPESVKFDSDGKEIRHPKKDPFTPEKVNRIKQLYFERLGKCSIDAASLESRVKNFNKIFASCVKNISNKTIDS